MLSQLLSGSTECEDWSATNGSAFTLWEPRHADFEKTLVSLRWSAYWVVMPVVIVSGLVGNAINLAVLTHRALRGVTYVYLSGLATADLGVLLSVIPMAVRLGHSESRSYSVAFFYAHAELVAVNSFMAASIFIVVCLTVDRYMSVCWPSRFHSVHTQRNARVAIAGSYVLAVAISCPLAALKSVCVVTGRNARFSFQENVGVTRTTSWLIYLWASETLVRFGPAVILAITNALIIRKFRNLTDKKKRFRAASNKFRVRHLLDSSATAATNTPPAGLRNRSYYEERRLVTLLTVIVVLFFVTMTPSALLSIKYSERRDVDLGFQMFRAVANNLEVGNFAFNFFVYFLCSKEFRRVLLGPCCRKGAALEQNNDGDRMEDFSRNCATARYSSEPAQSSAHQTVS